MTNREPFQSVVVGVSVVVADQLPEIDLRTHHPLEDLVHRGQRTEPAVAAEHDLIELGEIVGRLGQCETVRIRRHAVVLTYEHMIRERSEALSLGGGDPTIDDHHKRRRQGLQRRECVETRIVELTEVVIHGEQEKSSHRWVAGELVSVDIVHRSLASALSRYAP